LDSLSRCVSFFYQTGLTGFLGSFLSFRKKGRNINPLRSKKNSFFAAGDGVIKISSGNLDKNQVNPVNPV
jgi:hypothetical protein